jgi:hypoxanthine-DNA glycosylase
MENLTHGFPPFRTMDSEILILGSFPSAASRRGSFFYMHPRNRFWSVLAQTFDPAFAESDVAKRKSLLARHRIALYDVVESCSVEGSSDASIRNVVPADIDAILSGTKIRKILVNGQTAWRLFQKHQSRHLGLATPLPSTSPANAAVGFDALLAIWKKALKEG